MAINIITIRKISEAKSDNHTFLPVIFAPTQDQALHDLTTKYPWYDLTGGFAYWLETERGGSLWCPADWQRKP